MCLNYWSLNLLYQNWFGEINSGESLIGDNQRMNWFGKICSGVISDWGQSGNELIWENQFFGYLWLGTIKEWTDLGKSVMGLSLIGDNQGMNWFWKISFGVISDWGLSENELIWENKFWGYLWLGTIREWTDLGKSVLGLSLIGDNQRMNWFGEINSRDYFSDAVLSAEELIWANQLNGGTIWLQDIRFGGLIWGQSDFGKFVYLLKKNMITIKWLYDYLLEVKVRICHELIPLNRLIDK